MPQTASTTAANANAAAREGSSQGARLDAALMGGGGTVAPGAAPTAMPPRAWWEPLPGTWLFQPSSGLPCVRFVPMHETLVLSPTISEECAAALGLTATALPLLAPQAATTSAAQVPPVPQPAVALWSQRRPRLLELVSNLMAHGVTSHVPVTGNAGQTLLLSSLVGQLDEMIRNPLAVHGRAFPLEMLEIIQAQSNASHLCRSLLNHRHRPPSLSSPIQSPRRCYPHHCCPMLLQAELEVRWQQLSATIPLGLPQASPSAPSVAQLELHSSFIATEQAAATTAAAAAAAAAAASASASASAAVAAMQHGGGDAAFAATESAGAPSMSIPQTSAYDSEDAPRHS